MTSYGILFTDTASADLREIVFYVTEQGKNKKAAFDLLEKLKKKTDLLAEFPKSGSIPHDRLLKSEGYRSLVQEDYLIFYTVDEEKKEVYIKAFLHSSRDYFQVLKKII